MCLALLLVGCTRVATNVEVFHELPMDFAGKSITVVAADQNKAGTIEFKTYAAKLGAKLGQAGFLVVSPDSQAQPDYVAALAYGVGAVQAGAAHISGGITPDYAGGGRFGGTVTTEQQYPRALVVGIYRVPRDTSEEPQQVYMMTALSAGRCRALSAVIDPILDAAFTDFPGESGRSRTVTIPVPGLSC
jgi:hypothetical protein